MRVVVSAVIAECQCVVMESTNVSDFPNSFLAACEDFEEAEDESTPMSKGHAPMSEVVLGRPLKGKRALLYPQTLPLILTPIM